VEEAYNNVIEAVNIHLNDAQELGTLNELLAEARKVEVKPDTLGQGLGPIYPLLLE